MEFEDYNRYVSEPKFISHKNFLNYQKEKEKRKRKELLKYFKDLSNHLDDGSYLGVKKGEGSTEKIPKRFYNRKKTLRVVHRNEEEIKRRRLTYLTLKNIPSF